MSAYVVDDRIGRYFRRYELALRFLAHGARTAIAALWSEITYDQTVTLRRRWKFAPEDRQYGRIPSSFKPFFETAERINELSLLAAIQSTVGLRVTEDKKGNRILAPLLENGERLCEALEVFKEWHPTAKVDIERSILIAIGIVERKFIELTHCERCRRALLIDKLAKAKNLCERCEEKAIEARRSTRRKPRNG